MEGGREGAKVGGRERWREGGGREGGGRGAGRGGLEGGSQPISIRIEICQNVQSQFGVILFPFMQTRMCALL